MQCPLCRKPITQEQKTALTHGTYGYVVHKVCQDTKEKGTSKRDK